MTLTDKQIEEATRAFITAINSDTTLEVELGSVNASTLADPQPRRRYFVTVRRVKVETIY